MLKVNNEYKSLFSIKFGGDNAIEAQSLLGSIEGTLELLNYIVENENKDAYLKLKVESTSPGSFMVRFSTIVGVLNTLFTNGALSSGVDLAKSSIDFMVALFELKKHLNGEQPAEVKEINGVVQITNCKGKIKELSYNVYNLYNVQSDRAISKVMNSIPQDRKDFSIEKYDGYRVVIPQEEFHMMGKQVAAANEIAYKTETHRTKTNFKIKKADLNGISQWELISMENEKVIKVKINDEAFLQKLHNGDISINTKTVMNVTLDTIITYDELNQPIDTKFVVSQVDKISNEINKFEQIGFLEN